jgi:hypothetical protein
MTKQELDNLVRIGQLKLETATRAEFNGTVDSAKKRLVDAQNESLSEESQFDLAYGAAHGFALAALRQKGYRSENRYAVFQALAHTVDGLSPAAIRIFSKAHNERNLANTKAGPRLMGSFSKSLFAARPSFRRRCLRSPLLNEGRRQDNFSDRVIL